jgi:hypothetical protein
MSGSDTRTEVEERRYSNDKNLRYRVCWGHRGQGRSNLSETLVAKLSVQKQGVNVIPFPQRRCLSPLVPQLQWGQKSFL